MLRLRNSSQKPESLEVVCRVLKHTSMVHNLSVYELQERLAEPERQEQQRMVDLEVFDSLQQQLHQLGQASTDAELCIERTAQCARNTGV